MLTRIKPATIILSTLLVWLCGAIGLAIDAPWWFALLWGAALATRALPRGRRCAQIILLLLAALLTLGNWRSGIALQLIVPLVIALKWAESRQARDWILTLTGCVIVLALGSRYRLGVDGLALLMIGLVAMVYSLWGIAGYSSIKMVWRQILPALPLTLLLFLAFPRIQGPLWEIGLSLGLPLAVASGETQAGLGMQRKLTPGAAQDASDGRSRPIIVARFDGYIPPTSRLYWRGPVFYQFDGQSWQVAADNRSQLLSDGFRRRDDFLAQLPQRSQTIRYEARISAHGERWLYSLDLPARIASESFISRDGQLLSFTRLHQEGRYRSESWLEYDWQPARDAALLTQLKLANTWPEASQPRLAELGRPIARQNTQPQQRIASAIAALQHSGIEYQSHVEHAEVPPPSQQLDHAWFTQKKMDTTMLASSFALLLRSSGVPARLVTGFRGGRLVALTSMVLVKQEHAHAWVEAWDDKRGWLRLDPSDILLAANGVNNTNKKPAVATALAPASKTVQIASSAAQPSAVLNQAVWFKALHGWLNHWVIQLNSTQQKELLQHAKTLGSSVWFMAGILLLPLLYLAHHYIRRHRQKIKRAKETHEWLALERQLAGLGLTRNANECLSRYVARLPKQLPAHAQLLMLAERYGRWRFAAQTDPNLATDLRRWRQQLG